MTNTNTNQVESTNNQKIKKGLRIMMNQILHKNQCSNCGKKEEFMTIEQKQLLVQNFYLEPNSINEKISLLIEYEGKEFCPECLSEVIDNDFAMRESAPLHYELVANNLLVA